MAVITRVQIANINAACGNGWEIDVSHYVSKDEIQLVKYIEEDNIRYEYCLFYDTKYRVNRNGEMVKTNRYVVKLQMSEWAKSEDLELWVDKGIKSELDVITVDNTTLKKLQALTKEFDDGKLRFFRHK